MAETLTYKVQKYTEDIKNIFKGVYNDFKNKAYSEYKFELEPLEYEDFCLSVEQGLINCLVLLEEEIPTAFMVYTTEISEAVELTQQRAAQRKSCYLSDAWGAGTVYS